MKIIQSINFSIKNLEQVINRVYENIKWIYYKQIEYYVLAIKRFYRLYELIKWLILGKRIYNKGSKYVFAVIGNRIKVWSYWYNAQNLKQD